MYQSYSFQRSGRPRWAWVVSGLLLAGMLLLAALLIRYKAGLYDVPLSAETVTLTGPIRMSIPQGWTLIPDSGWPAGVVGAWTEPPDAKGTARQLYVLWGLPSRRALPSLSGAATILEFASDLAGGMEHLGAPQQVDNDPLGVWPGTTYQMPIARFLQARRPEMYSILARAGVIPQGQVLVVALVAARPMTSGDSRLLSKLGDSMQLPTTVSDDAARVLKNAGIEFKLPAGVRALSQAEPANRRVLLLSNPDEPAWFLDLHRVPRMAGRTSPQLVADFLMSHSEQVELVEGTEITMENNRRVARGRLPGLGRVDTTVVEVYCADIDEQTSLWLLGRAEPLAEGRMQELARTIAGEAQVRSFAEFNPAGVHAATAKLLNRLAERGLGVYWRQWRDEQLVYLLQSPGRDLARETNVLQSSRRQDQTWWELQSKLRNFGSPIRSKTFQQEDWQIRDDGRAYSVRRIRTGPQEYSYAYDEQGIAGGQIARKLLLKSGVYRETTAETGETFACEPVLIEALAEAALDRQAEFAIFSTTETFAPEPVFWVAEFIGPAPIPGDVEQTTATAVRIQCDFDPRPITLYFGDSRQLLAIGYDEGMWKLLVR